MNSAPMLVDVGWLINHLPEIQLIDARSPMRYAQGHIAGALSLTALALTRVRPDRVRILGAPGEIEQVLRSSGINESNRIVIYGERGGQDAAFLYWALDIAGVQRMSLLDGGIEAWLRAGYAFVREVPATKPSAFKIKWNSAQIVTSDWLLEHLADKTLQLVDNRTQAEFTGEDALSMRGGHIPGAVHFEWSQALNADLTFKSPEEIRKLMTEHGIEARKSIVNYCHAGARSAHARFVMTLAGLSEVRNYEAGWFEWGNHSKFPIETGAVRSEKNSVTLERTEDTNQIDLRGELCPYTLIYTKKKIDELLPGAKLQVLIDNEDATQTIPAWAEQTGHQILKLEPSENGWRIVIQKRGK
jgi:thiosulfate/3-mercaptopyruvate sulfurtransferase